MLVVFWVCWVVLVVVVVVVDHHHHHHHLHLDDFGDFGHGEPLFVAIGKALADDRMALMMKILIIGRWCHGCGAKHM